ncbi:RNA-directed DNA polymerase, eukaryota [Tanacetum coccineum]
MGNLCMLFKKFGTVYDMFMVQKWLRNGQQYGFVRFKLVANANTLLKRLHEIKFGDEYLMVFIAFDRRNTRVSGFVDNNDAGNENNVRARNGWGNRNNTRIETQWGWSERREAGNMEDKKEEHTKLGVNKETREDKEDVIIIEGLCDVEIKLLDGLEVMLVFDTPETATNIIRSIDHGIRRWVHKLRRWSKEYILSGRLTWIDIIGIDVVEEIRNIMEFDLEETDKGRETDSDEEEVEEGAGHEFWPPDGGGRNVEVVEESRWLGKSWVCETPAKEIIKGDKKAAIDTNRNEETHDLEGGLEVKKDLGLDKDIGPDTCNEYPIQLELESGLNENRKDGEKRGEHPVTSNSSGGDRLNKKRRENENDFEEINKVKVFVKEIGELIGVSWVSAENEKTNEAALEMEKKDKEGETEIKQGIGEVGNKEWIRTIIRSKRPNIIGIRETKCGMVDDSWVEDLWGGRDFGFSQLAANGSSGEILLIWDTRSFTYNEGLRDERFVAIKGEWKGKNREVCLACIYGSHVGRQKASLWNRLLGVMNDTNGPWCIFGDLNVVRGDEERMVSQVNLKEANDFNDFINEAKLVEIPIRGRKFTRVSDDEMKLYAQVQSTDVSPIFAQQQRPAVHTQQESKIMVNHHNGMNGLHRYPNRQEPELVGVYDNGVLADVLNCPKGCYTVGLIYLNIKEDKRIIDMVDRSKFCDTTLEKVLKEVKLKIFQIEFKIKTSLHGELELNIMKAYEREIMKRLKHRKQMRRYESFVKGRPIL